MRRGQQLVLVRTGSVRRVRPSGDRLNVARLDEPVAPALQGPLVVADDGIDDHDLFPVQVIVVLLLNAAANQDVDFFGENQAAEVFGGRVGQDEVFFRGRLYCPDSVQQ